VENRTQAIRIVERLEQVHKHLAARGRGSVSLRDWLLPHMSDESITRRDCFRKGGIPARALYYIQQGKVALPEIGKQMGEGTLSGRSVSFAPEHSAPAARAAKPTPALLPYADRAKRPCTSRILNSPIM